MKKAKKRRVVAVDMKFNLRLSKPLVEMLDRFAERSGVSRNRLICDWIALLPRIEASRADFERRKAEGDPVESLEFAAFALDVFARVHTLTADQAEGLHLLERAEYAAAVARGEVK